MKKIISVFILFCICYVTFAQDTNIVKYFPLKVDNIWVYKDTAGLPYNTYSIRREVIDYSTVYNNKKYFHFNTTIHHLIGSSDCTPIQFSLIRIDSVNGGLYVYSTSQGCAYSPNEYLWDSLKLRIHIDTARAQCGLYNNTCSDTLSVNVFGMLRQSKYFSNRESGIGEYGFVTRYVKNIGITSSDYDGMSWTCFTTLKGCIINGVLYGDTGMLTGINQIQSEIPDKFYLYQNYPNPFNPMTKIKFQIAKLGNVELKVFDVIGREIATLVNEKLNAGSYEVEWDGSAYSSGMYFYKLEIRDAETPARQSGGSSALVYEITKKMVLLK